MFLWVIKRDLLLAMRQRADVLTTLFFFVIVVSLFPLGVGPEINMLRAMAPGVVWVAALLASMLSLERMFFSDYLDGTLEQMLLSPQPLSLLVLGKALAHWLVTGVPLALIAPILGVQFDLSIDVLLVLTASLSLTEKFKSRVVGTESTVMEPAGKVMAIVGEVISITSKLLVSFAVLPARSEASMKKVWEPMETPTRVLLLHDGRATKPPPSSLY